MLTYLFSTVCKNVTEYLQMCYNYILYNRLSQDNLGFIFTKIKAPLRGFFIILIIFLGIVYPVYQPPALQDDLESLVCRTQNMGFQIYFHHQTQHSKFLFPGP